MGNDLDGSVPQNIPISTCQRTVFGRLGCTVYGYPSTGGVLIKEADVLDMIFLSLDRLNPTQRSPDIHSENLFCEQMRRIGATWWTDEQEWIDVELGMKTRTALQRRVLIFGWPTTGGVWVLRFEDEDAVPRDLGRLALALNMDEKVRVMRQYGARYYGDPDSVPELRAEL